MLYVLVTRGQGTRPHWGETRPPRLRTEELFSLGWPIRFNLGEKNTGENKFEEVKVRLPDARQDLEELATRLWRASDPL